MINNSASYLSIVTVLRMINSSVHLSRLAKLIGKSKSTTLVHLDNLIDQSNPLIEVDTERTLNTRGSKKFYKLSNFGTQTLQYQLSLLKQIPEKYSIDFESIENSDFPDIVKHQMLDLFETFGEEGMKNYFSLGAELNQNIESMASNQYVELAKKLYKAHKKGKNLDEIENPKIAFGTFLSHSIQIQVPHLKYIERIQQESLEFLKKMKALQKEFHDEISAQIEEGVIKEEDIGIQNIYLGLAPIFRE